MEPIELLTSQENVSLDVVPRLMGFIQHGMREPVGNILALSDTLALQRVSVSSVPDYAKMLRQEAVRLQAMLEQMVRLVTDQAARHPYSHLSLVHRYDALTDKRNTPLVEWINQPLLRMRRKEIDLVVIRTDGVKTRMIVVRRHGPSTWTLDGTAPGEEVNTLAFKSAVDQVARLETVGL